MDIDSDDSYRESSSEHEVPSAPIPVPLHIQRALSPIRGSIPIHRKRRVETPPAPAHTPAAASSIVIGDGSPPLKRRKGAFNAGYLDLLNRDIDDASSGTINSGPGRGENADLKRAQIGAVVWSTAEKAAFYSALGRLGRADHAGIAARVGTKSELEVRQFLAFLDAAAAEEERKRDGKGERARRKQALRPADVPAAVEIGAGCEAALDVAADALALRQESWEERIEKKRWSSRWRVTKALAGILESQQGQRRKRSERLTPRFKSIERGWEDEEDANGGRKLQLEAEGQGAKEKRLDEMPLLQFFSVENWLRLSDRIFMNSAILDNNWRAASEGDEPPAIRMTALADFYGLVVSITRRLLLAALYMAESRRRKSSSEAVQRRKKLRVRVDDVKAAVSSLGMKQGSEEFWARCARRLRLDVVDDRTEDEFANRGEESDDNDDEEVHVDSGEKMDEHERAMSAVESPFRSSEGSELAGEEEEDEDDGSETEIEIMSYDEVEAALGYPIVDSLPNRLSRPSTPESITHAPAKDTHNISSDSAGEDTDHPPAEQPEQQEEDDSDYETDIKMEDHHEPPADNDDLNTEAIALDIEEALLFSTQIEYASRSETIRNLKSRIRAEHRLERDAELLDAEASAREERELWALLRGDGGGESRVDE